MNGVIITTALRPLEAEECLKRVLEYTPAPYKVILIHNAGRPDLDAEWPKLLAFQYSVEYHKMIPGQSGGMTAAWNYGFQRFKTEECDAIVCMNDDVYVNSDWYHIFDTIRLYPNGFIGPTSNNPGMDYTGHQKQSSTINKQWIINKETPAGSRGKLLYCLNGFCFGLSGPLCNDLIQTYGDVLDQETYPWGGQEEDLGRRIQKIGGPLVIEGRTFVHHLKFCDWRALNLHKQ